MVAGPIKIKVRLPKAQSILNRKDFMKSEFQKILESKMSQNESVFQESKPEPMKNVLASQLLELHLDGLQTFRKYDVSQTSYSKLKRNPEEIKMAREEKMRKQQDSFLNGLPEGKIHQAACFFFKYGAIHLIEKEILGLKKDFRLIAKQLHPDRHTVEKTSVRDHFQREFQAFLDHFEALKTFFEREK